MYIFIITREGVGTIYDSGLTTFGRGIVNRIIEHLQVIRNILLYSYCRAQECSAGRRLLLIDPSLVNPLVLKVSRDLDA